MYGFAPDFGGRPFSLVHYLAVRSACVVNDPECVNFYFKHEPSGEWWERAKPYLNLMRIEPPTEVAGRRLCHPAHQADVVRLQLLLEHGGIYLDIDVICVRPLTPLLRYPFVLGEQGVRGEEGLGNAVILSEKGAFFARKWLEGFDPATSLWQGFRSSGADDLYGELSMKYPLHLARLFPEHVHIEAHTRFYWPLFLEHHLHWFFLEQGSRFEDAYCHHLWESLSWDRYLRDLTVDYIKDVPTNFNTIARRFLD